MVIDKELLDKVSAMAKSSERLRMNHNFHESLNAKAQRLLNALEPGTMLPIHRHLHTAETYILLRGRIKVIFYNEVKEVTDVFNLNPVDEKYGVHIPKGQWHTLEVLEKDTVIFEVKDGPYMPLDSKDKMD